MSNNTLPLAASCLHDTFRALLTPIRLHAERQGQLNGCPCYTIAPFLLEHLHHWLSLPGTQCHGPSSHIASGWTSCGNSALDTLNTTTSTVDAPFAWDVESPSSGVPSPMEPDSIIQSLTATALDRDNEMDASFLGGLDPLEGSNFNPEHFLGFHDSFHPELNLTPSVDHFSPQMWSPHALLQSPSTSSSNGSSSCDDAWANEHHEHGVGPLPYDIQPHIQNSSDVYPSSLFGGADLQSPTSSWSEDRRSDCASLMDEVDDALSFCRWSGGSCISYLTVDKSEVAKHLQIHHGVKIGGDKDKMSCNWDGCGKEMKKESISRHIVAVHLSNKTMCSSCGKQFARLDSKLRHLKNSKREECRESEPHDSRAKRRCLSWS